MAITHNQLISPASSTTNLNSYSTGAFVPGANRLCLLTVINASGETPPTTPTVTGGGMTTWTQVNTATSYDSSQAQECRVTVFRSLQASPGSSAAAVIDFSGNTQSGCAWSVEEFDGVDTGGTNGAAAVVQSATADLSGGNATSLSVTLASFADATNNVAFGGISCRNQDPAVGSGFTQLAETSHSSPTNYINTMWKTGEDTGVDWTFGSHDTAAAVALEMAAGDTAVTGSGALSLPSLEVAGSGAVAVAGSGAISLPSLEVAGAGYRDASGSGALALPSLTAAGTGTGDVVGSGALTLPSAQVANAGVKWKDTGTATGTGVSTIDVTVDIGSGKNRKVVGFANWYVASPAAMTSVTFDPGGGDSAAFTVVPSGTVELSEQRAEAWYYDVPDVVAGGTFTIRFTLPATVSTIIASAHAVWDAKTGAPEAVDTTSSAAATSISPTITTLSDRAMVLEGLGLATDAGNPDPDDGQVEVYQETVAASPSISHNQLIAPSGSTTNTNSYSTAAFAPGANRLALLTVVSSENLVTPPTTPTVTGGGMTTWTQVATDHSYDSSQSVETRVSVFRALQASPGSPAAAVIDFAGNTQAGCLWSVEEFEDVDTGGTNGADAIVQSAGANLSGGSATSLSVTLASFADATNNVAFGALANRNQDPTVGAGFTELAETSHVTPTTYINTMWKTGEDLGVDWTFSSHDTAAAVAVEIAVGAAFSIEGAGSRNFRGVAGATDAGWSWGSAIDAVQVAVAVAPKEQTPTAAVISKESVGHDDTNAGIKFDSFDAGATEHDVYAHTAPMAGDPEANGTLIANDANPALSHFWSGRTGGTNYWFQVVSRNAFGDTLSNQATFQTAPKKPTSASASPGSTDGTIDTSFTNPATTEAGVSAHYRVDGTSDPYLVEDGAADATAIPITGLVNGQTYEIRFSSFSLTTGRSGLTVPITAVAKGGGAGAITLPALSVSGAGVTSRSGSGTLLLGAIGVVGAGVNFGTDRTGSGALTLGTLSVVGVGYRTILGSGALTLPLISIASPVIQGTFTPPGLVRPPFRRAMQAEL